MSVGTNIKALREKFGLDQNELADRLGVTRESVNRWETDKMAIRDRHVAKMVELFGIDPEDIKSERYGLAGSKTPHAIPANAIIPSPTCEVATAPLLGRVHAGNAQPPDIINDTVELPASVRRNHPNAYFLQVEGNCMDRVYPEGCYILIDPDRTPQNGSIAVVSIDGEDYVMRRMTRGASTLMLSPDSTDPKHEDIVISSSDDHTVEFFGTVVWYQPSKELE